MSAGDPVSSTRTPAGGRASERDRPDDTEPFGTEVVDPAAPVPADPAPADRAGVRSVTPDPAVAPLGPESLTWALGFSRPLLLLAGRALLMQVAHPVIGAGVRDHSTFQADPWTRFTRTVDSLALQLLGGQESLTEASRLADLHGRITGTGFDGTPYRALDPEAGAWVHLVNYDSVIEAHRWLATPLTREQAGRLYGEWRQVGLLLGIPSTCMPADLAALDTYMDRMIHGALGYNVTVKALLDTLGLGYVAGPTIFPRRLWRLAKAPVGRVGLDFTVGTLPPALRTRLGLAWTARDERRLEAVAFGVRRLTPLLPERAVHHRLGRRARAAVRAAGRRPGLS
jgi:uncharacterized protein (DUF2236 family)